MTKTTAVAYALAVESLVKSKAEIAALLDEAEVHARDAVAAYDAGLHALAKRSLTAACDLEWEALGDCEATGTLSEVLYPDGEFEDADEQACACRSAS